MRMEGVGALAAAAVLLGCAGPKLSGTISASNDENRKAPEEAAAAVTEDAASGGAAPADVLSKVRSGLAKPHGLVLLGSGGTASCRTYLEKVDDDHVVFYLLRDGKYYGEFRRVELDDGRFLKTEELFLTIPSRGRIKGRAARELEYVLVETNYVWREGALADRYKRYRSIVKDRKGNAIREGDWELDRVLDDEITVNLDLPGGFDESDLYLEWWRTGMLPLERLVDDRLQDCGDFVGRKKVDGRQCVIKIAYSTAQPEVTLSLVRKVTIPRDACPFIFRKKVLKTETMRINATAPDTHVLKCE